MSANDSYLIVRVSDGVVVDACQGNPEDAFGVGFEAVRAADVAAGAWIGWTRQQDGTFAIPVTAPTKDDLTAYAAARRYELEVGGTVTVGGVPIPTDERTISKITAAYTLASEDPEYTVRWKVGPNLYVTLDADSIKAVGTAMREYVQGVFDLNEVADAAIDAGTVTTTDGVDAIFMNI